MARWSKCPTWWTRGEGMLAFKGGASSGASIAALKCVVGISTSIDFSSRKARLSISNLETLTGLSRPMVVRGIELLEKLEILVVDRTNHVNEYELTVQGNDDKWAKLPFDLVRKHLSQIPNRGVVPLTALKIYLLLVSLRPNESTALSIGYDKMRDLLGVQKAQIRSALDILYSHSLIRIMRNEEVEGKHNVYTILGL